MQDKAEKKSFRENHREVVNLLKKATTLDKLEKGKIFVYTDLCDELQEQASCHKEYRLESEVFQSITSLARPTDKTVDVREVLRGLTDLLSTKSWKKLGEGVNIRGGVNVGATTFLGALDVAPRRRQQQRRAFTASKQPLEKPTHVKDAMDSNDSTTKRTEILYKAILENGSTPFAETVLDAGSFGNTVVNLFCLQLLVNRGKIMFSESTSEGMLLQAIEKGNGKSSGAKTQRILRINKRVWECMKEVVRAEDCLMQVTEDNGVDQPTQSTADEGPEPFFVDVDPELTAEKKKRQPDNLATPDPFGKRKPRQPKNLANPDPFGKRKATCLSADRSQVPPARRGVAPDEGPSGAAQSIDDCTQNGADIGRGNSGVQFSRKELVEESDDGGLTSSEGFSDEGDAAVDPTLPDIHFKSIISQANLGAKSLHEHNPQGSNVDGGRSLKKRKVSGSENGEAIKTPLRRSQVLSENADQMLECSTPVKTPLENVNKDDTAGAQTPQTPKTPKTKRRQTGSPRLSTARKKRRQELLRIEAEKRNKDPRPVQERLDLNFPKSTPTPKRQVSMTEYLSRMKVQAPARAPVVLGKEPEEDEKKPMIDLCVPSTVEEDGPILIDLTGEAPVVERIKRPAVIDLS